MRPNAMQPFAGQPFAGQLISGQQISGQQISGQQIAARALAIRIGTAALIGLSLWSLVGSPSRCAERAPHLSMRMESDPDLSIEKPLLVYPEYVKELWTEALGYDEADMKQLAARSILQSHRNGLTGWEVAGPALRKNLLDKRASVRLATAAAMVQLDMKDDARQLADVADADGLAMRQIVELALAKWRFEPRIADWISWLEAPIRKQARARLAIRALSEVKSKEAEATLLNVVKDEQASPSLRLTAADALGGYVQGLESTAAELAKDEAPTTRILASRMLAAHESPESLAILLALMKDDQRAVSTAAIQLAHAP